MSSAGRREYHEIALDIAEQQTGQSGELRLVIVSKSMSPLLQPGDAVYVRPQESYQIGEILSYRRDAQVITHRLVKQGTDNLILKGDQGRRFDHPVQTSRVLGRVVALEREGLRAPIPESRINAWVARLSRLEGRIVETVSGTPSAPRLDDRIGMLLAFPARLICSFLIGRHAIK